MKKEMKKWLCGVGALAICVMLTGCGHEHTWIEATCTEPKICSECGETEGEALGHTWVEATCAEPKHCSVCGETEGEALEHTLTEANYQQPATCEVCGTEVGEPLQADFEKYNLTEHMVELDKEYDCVTMCYDDSSYTTVGKLFFSNYQTFAYGTPEKSGNFTLNTDLPEKAGYEYKVLDITITYSDENALKYGEYVGMCWENNYDIVGFDDSWQNRDDGWTQFTVNWNGTDYTECMFSYVGEWLSDSDADIYNGMCIVRVPVGYDGFVIGLYNRKVERGEGQYIFDVDNTDTIFFRFE